MKLVKHISDGLPVIMPASARIGLGSFERFFVPWNGGQLQIALISWRSHGGLKKQSVTMGQLKTLVLIVITRGTTSQVLGSISFSFFFFSPHVAISDSVE